MTIYEYPFTELVPIELVWGLGKKHSRDACDGSVPGLRNSIPRSLNKVTHQNICNFFRHCRDLVHLYDSGVGIDTLEKLQKIKKSHRAVYVSATNATDMLSEAVELNP